MVFREPLSQLLNLEKVIEARKWGAESINQSCPAVCILSQWALDSMVKWGHESWKHMRAPVGPEAALLLVPPPLCLLLQDL